MIFWKVQVRVSVWPCTCLAVQNICWLCTTVNEKLTSHIHWHPPLSSFHLFPLSPFSWYSTCNNETERINLYHVKWRCPSIHTRMINDVEVGDFFGNTGKNILGFLIRCRILIGAWLVILKFNLQSSIQQNNAFSKLTMSFEAGYWKDFQNS